MMECWIIGIVRIKGGEKQIYFFLAGDPLFQYSIIPIFHYSNIPARVKRTLEWSKKYFEQRGATFSEISQSSLRREPEHIPTQVRSVGPRRKEGEFLLLLLQYGGITVARVYLSIIGQRENFPLDGLDNLSEITGRCGLARTAWEKGIA